MLWSCVTAERRELSARVRRGCVGVAGHRQVPDLPFVSTRPRAAMRGHRMRWPRRRRAWPRSVARQSTMACRAACPPSGRWGEIENRPDEGL